jgi:ribosome maturation factor RimP
MKMQNAAELLIGKLVKLVYRDGSEVKVRKGKLLAADQNFITIQTDVHTYVVPVSAVVEIKTIEEGQT